MNYNKKSKILIIIFSLVLIISMSAIYASVLFKSFVVAKATVETDTTDVIVVDTDSTTPIKVSSLTNSITFTKSGDYTELDLALANYTNSVIEYQYEFAFDGNTFTLQTESFASCILVYYNGEFIDTLANICVNEDNRVESGKIDFKGFVDKATTASESTTNDKIKFVLHNAADASIFDDATMSFNIRVYANTADYEHNMFVRNATELKKAFNDLNTGLLPSNAKIVLFNDITLTDDITLNYPVEIDLNGNELIVNSTLTLTGEGTYKIKSSKKMSINSLSQTGSIVLNSIKAILDIEDFYSITGTNVGYLYSTKSTATAYNSTLLSSLIESRVKNNVRYGISSSSSINLFGGLTFYNLSVTPSANLTYSKPNLTASTTSYNDMESITIDLDTDLTIGVKIISEANAAILESILENELLHLVTLSQENSGNLINTNAADLFLPTSIKDKNVTIEWVSSDESLISNTGIISSNISGDAIVTLYAHITINDKVYTESFKIKTMSQNHETIFQYFIAQLSPIEIDQVYSGDKNVAYYFLPIVDSTYDPADNSSYTGYDYRSTYQTPPTGKTYTWEGFNNVGFQYIKYTPISTYNFISLDQNASNNNKDVAVYLNSATFQTFAQVQVTAKFNGDEQIYTAPANIVIKLGYNTELNELVFNKVSEDLSETNVLQNILDTRKESGMINEKGDFFLDGSYQTYLISYTIPESSKDVISSIIAYDENDNVVDTIEYGDRITDKDILQTIVKYKVCLNIEGFDTSDTNFGITTVLSMPGVTETASRILYFKCPGIIKNDDTGFANMSVFNSVKYQVYKELCEITSEKGDSDVRDEDYTTAAKNSTSFVVSGSILTNKTGAYILRHDANQCTKLAFSLAETNTNTDNHIVYGLAKLIDWAVGTDSTTTFNDYFSGILDSSFISSYSSVKSNGLTVLSYDEVNIIQNYYSTYISSTGMHDIWDDVTYTEENRMISNTSNFFNAITEYINGSSSTYGTANNDNQFIKIQDIYKWATGELTTGAYSDGGVSIPAGCAPDGGLVGSGEWTIDITASYNSWTLNSKYMGSSNYGAQYYNSKYFKSQSSHYVQDTSEYINDVELEILIVALLNCRVSTSTTTGSNSNYKSAAKQKVYEIVHNYMFYPTYFKETGIADIINQAYKDLNKSFNSTTGFKSELKSFTVMGDSFETPTVTSFNYSTIGFDYFPNLDTLYIIGDYNKLKAFHNETALMNCFNRVIKNNTKLENIAFEYCSDIKMDFSLRSIYYAKNLKKIDLYHNMGITNIGALLKLDLSQLSYVDVGDINIKFDYYEFVMQAIKLKSSSSSVYYQPDNSTNHLPYTTALSSDAEGLIYLEEFYELIGENSSLTENVYIGDTPTTIQWKIEAGNGINYVSTGENVTLANEAYQLKEIYFKYYLVLNTFEYGNDTFLANHLYYVYNDGNGNVAFGAVKDENNKDIVVSVVNSVPTSLSNEDISNYIQENNIVAQSESTPINEKTVGEWSNLQTLSNYSGSNQTGNTSLTAIVPFAYNNPKRITITYEDNTTETLSVYGLGYYSGQTASRTTTTRTGTEEKQGIIQFSLTKYYATVENGLYIIQKITYDYNTYNSTSSYTETTLNENIYNFYYASDGGRRYNWGWTYTYTYKNLYSEKGTIKSISYNGTKNLFSNTYGYTSSTTSNNYGPTATNTTINQINTQTNYYSATSLTSTKIDDMNDALYNKYVKFVPGTTTYCSYYPTIPLYDNGTLTSNTSYGNYQGNAYQINITNNGFTYTQIATNSSTYLAYPYIKKMLNILDEANTHLDDQAFGLYYHNYYAFMCNYDFSYKDYSFTAHGIYYLEIGNDGRFYWAQSQNANETYYTIVDGLTSSNTSHSADDRNELFDIASNLTASDVGKIYYFTGTAVNDGSTGTNEFFQAVYNSSTGLYELKRFGVLDWKYYFCNTGSGNYYDTDTIGNKVHIPSANRDTTDLKFKVLCNQMSYVDSSFLWGGNSSSSYRYGVGGTRQAVFTAVITVNGVKYERKFVINVIGLY